MASISAVDMTNHPEDARMFVQEGCGKPWKFVGAVTVRNIQLDPQSIQYDRTVKAGQGVVVQSMRRTADPQPFDVNFADNLTKWQSLHQQIIRAGCRPNFLFVNAKCRNRALIDDPSHNSDGLILYNVDVASPYGMGNNTFITRDDQQTARREDTLQFTSTDYSRVRDWKFLAKGTAPIDTNYIAVLDEGECADGLCRNYEKPGGAQMLISGTSAAHYTVDGGATWSALTGAGAGIPIKVGKYMLYVEASGIKLSDDLTKAYANWIAAIPNVAFAGLTSVAAIDLRTVVAAGTGGAVWRSVDGGAVWTQVRGGSVPGAGLIQAMAYNPETNLLVGVQGVTASPAKIIASSDFGATWVDVFTTADNWGANSNAIVCAAGNATYVVSNGKLYKLSYTTTGALTATAIVVGAAHGNITGIAAHNNSCNQLFVTAGSDTATEALYSTLDGFASQVTALALPFSLPASTSLLNPVAVANTKYGNSVYGVIGTQMVEARDWDSFFV